MPAAYDSYDYPSYWKERRYEHDSEVIAIRSFLSKIPKFNTALDVGAGFGRLTPTYINSCKKVYITDPSSKLLKLARQRLKRGNIKYIHGGLETLPKKLIAGKVDVVLLIRVLHHLKDPEKSLKLVHNITEPKGYLILEFANKRHFKASIINILKGNFTFPFDIFPIDIRSVRGKKMCNLPFRNYHPTNIIHCLEKAGFDIIETRSVSNVRNKFLKKHVPKKILLRIEELLQKPLAKLNFGPSIFILAQKSRNH